jgi:hypothetical protein
MTATRWMDLAGRLCLTGGVAWQFGFAWAAIVWGVLLIALAHLRGEKS